MSSIKSMVGHSLGAIGAIEIVACALALAARRGAADRQLRDPRPRVRPGLRAAHRTRHAELRSVLSVGSGFGGFQSAVVLTRPGGRTR